MGKAHKLTVKQVEAAKPGTVLQDGAGLMLHTGPNGASRWILRVQVNGDRRDIGLGSFPVITLQKARAAALDIRRAYADGRDPVQERRGGRKPVPTFKEAAQDLHEECKKGWRNEKTEKHWLKRLEAHAFPRLGDVKVSEITGPQIRDTLAEIWTDRPVMARKVRGQIIRVLDYAHARGWRPVEAPRTIGRGLPTQQHIVQHHRALDWRDLPAFVEILPALKCSAPVRAAIEFVLLTACRSGEARGMTWAEVDLDAGLWVVPAHRMKTAKVHRVPLSPRAVAILREMEKLRATTSPAEYVFPSRKRGKPLSDMSLSMPLRRAGIGMTPHGCRSSFRTWASEAAEAPRELAEMSLAHALQGEVEKAYSRGDLLDRRRRLMARWADYLRTGRTLPDNVRRLDSARKRGAA